MPAITATDLNNAKADVDHIADVATSTLPTATDRLGHVKRTVQGAIDTISAITNRGSWVTGTVYAVKDIVQGSGTWYICVVAHTASSAFETDIAKWRVYQGVTAGDLADTTDAAKGAALVGYLPDGTGAVGVDVGARLNEIVSLSRFGAITGVDDTATFQKALDYIAANVAAELITVNGVASAYAGTLPKLRLPRGRLKISAALNLPAYLEIDGESTIIEQTTSGADIFTGEAYQWSIKGVVFVGGRHHINFYNQNINSAMVSVRDCQFFLSADYAINSYSNHATYTHLSTDLSIVKSRFISCNKILNNCCDHALIDTCWLQVSKDNFTPSTAAINNKGTSATDLDAMTRMHIRDTFLIPDIGTQGVDRVENARWIDNYGSFTATHSRFGGEGGGLSILWHLGAPIPSAPWNATEVIFKECALFAGPDVRVDSCAVGIQGQVPNRIVIHNCTGPVGNPLIANLSSLDIPAYMTAFVTASGRKAYEWFKIDIQDALTDINVQVPARIMIPSALYPYAIKGKQTQIRRATSQSTANGFANNLVSFDTVDFDNVGAFSATTPTRLMMPKGCSKMRINVSASIAVDGAAKTIAVSVIDSGMTRVSGVTGLRGLNPDSDRISFVVDVMGEPGGWWYLNIQHNAAAALNLFDCRVSLTPLDFVG